MAYNHRAEHWRNLGGWLASLPENGSGITEKIVYMNNLTAFFQAMRAIDAPLLGLGRAEDGIVFRFRAGENGSVSLLFRHDATIECWEKANGD